MNPAQTASSEYDLRLRRAEKLIAEKSAASEVLSFYCRVAAFQKGLLSQIAESQRRIGAWNPNLRMREPFDLTDLLPHFRGFLALAEKQGPPGLSAAAEVIAAEPPELWIAELLEYWANGGLAGRTAGPFEQFFARAFLEPYAMFVESQISRPAVLSTPRVCPLCGAQPMAGVLRPEGDGGKRSLICSFCGHEWNFRRIWCAACGEEDEKKQPVYVAEQLPHIRVECCETCKFYMRTVDLTKDGHAVPVVDDLAAIPLTLWAHERGYARLQPNLFGS